jgi:fatty acid-binding protein DegV
MDHLFIALIVTLLVFVPIIMFMNGKLTTFDRQIRENTAALLSSARDQSRRGEWVAASASYKSAIIENIGEDKVLQQIVPELSELYLKHFGLVDLTKVFEFGCQYNKCFEGIPDGCTQKAAKVDSELRAFLAELP